MIALLALVTLAASRLAQDGRSLRRVVHVPDDGSWGPGASSTADVDELLRAAAREAETLTPTGVQPGVRTWVLRDEPPPPVVDQVGDLDGREAAPARVDWVLAGLPRPTPEVLAIDPGSSRSAWVWLDSTGVPLGHGLVPNEELLGQLTRGSLGDLRQGWFVLKPGVEVVVEWTAPRGMPASAELFETMWWAGRFHQAVPAPASRLQRARVKLALTGSSAAKDANVRAALIDRFGGTGGKALAIGLKRSPGPLFGIHADEWAALAVAVAWREGAR